MEWHLRDFVRNNKKLAPADRNAFAYYERKFTRAARSTYEWSDPVFGRRVERYLWEGGRALVWRHPMLGVVVTRATPTAYNINGEAIRWRAFFDYVPAGMSQTYELTNEEAAEILDLTDPGIMRRDCLVWIQDIVDCRAARMQQIHNQRTPLIGVATDTQMKRKLRDAIVAIGTNQSVLILDQPINTMVQPLDLNAPFNVEDITSVEKNIENEVLEYLGLDNTAGFEKKERMVVSEQESNEDILNAMLLDGLNARRAPLEDINRMFALSLSVKVSESVRPKPEQGGDDDADQSSE